MPPYDEAIVALDFDGFPVWRWRPREIDNLDLAFGAAPNLFSIELGGDPIEVLGVGGKDGTYYVLDRDGVNESNQVAWDEFLPGGGSPPDFPYWTRNVVPGGDIGGIIATAVRRRGARRVFFSTAPGTAALNSPPFGATSQPQRPTVHALDMDTGAIVWQNDEQTTSDASFAPTSGIPGADLRRQRAPEHPARLSDGRRQRDAAALLESVGRRRDRLGLRRDRRHRAVRRRRRPARLGPRRPSRTSSRACRIR